MGKVGSLSQNKISGILIRCASFVEITSRDTENIHIGHIDKLSLQSNPEVLNKKKGFTFLLFNYPALFRIESYFDHVMLRSIISYIHGKTADSSR